MARAVYSTRFLASPAPDFPPTYTVPAGYVAVVRDIEIYCAPGEGGDHCTVLLVDPPCIIFDAGSLTAGQTVHWGGRQVLNAGESLTVDSGLSEPSSVLISGYLLTLD